MKKDLRIKFYHWFRYRLIKDDPARWPTGISKLLSIILFPLDHFYYRQSGIKYSWETNIYTVEGERVRGNVFWLMSQVRGKSISLTCDEEGNWEVTKID